MAEENEYKQQFQEFHYKKESRNGKGIASSLFVCFNLGEETVCFHAYGNNLVKIKS